MTSSSLLRTDKELAELYRRHVDTIYRVCYALLKNAPEAEDAVQTVFVKLLECPISFESPAHERAWLITTAKNHCLDQLRCWWKKRRVDYEALPELSAPDAPEQGEAFEALMALPPKYKLPLYLFYYEGYASAEIAALLGEKDTTIRTRLRNGRLRLKTVLEGYDDADIQTKSAL